LPKDYVKLQIKNFNEKNKKISFSTDNRDKILQYLHIKPKDKYTIRGKWKLII
jgi:hypothetical protein